MNTGMNPIIYMDSCCFNRPFDDLSNDTIRFESEAILTIVDRSERSCWQICKSDVLYDELSRMTDFVKREKVLTLYNCGTLIIDINEVIVERAKILHCANIKPFDALHIASAEYGNADVFLTTDKQLLNAAKRASVGINVMNPVVWLMEVLFHE